MLIVSIMCWLFHIHPDTLVSSLHMPFPTGTILHSKLQHSWPCFICSCAFIVSLLYIMIASSTGTLDWSQQICSLIFFTLQHDTDSISMQDTLMIFYIIFYVGAPKTSNGAKGFKQASNADGESIFMIALVTLVPPDISQPLILTTSILPEIVDYFFVHFSMRQ